MKKDDTIREILKKLITENKQLGYYTKASIEKAIIEVRGPDYRTINNWFTYLWKLEYLLQPEPGIFHLNLNKISKLEISEKLPKQIDSKQSRLGAFSS